MIENILGFCQKAAKAVEYGDNRDTKCNQDALKKETGEIRNLM